MLLFERNVGLPSIVYAFLLSIRMQKSVGSFVKSPWRGGTLTGYECFRRAPEFPIIIPVVLL